MFVLRDHYTTANLSKIWGFSRCFQEHLSFLLTEQVRLVPPDCQKSLSLLQSELLSCAGLPGEVCLLVIGYKWCHSCGKFEENDTDGPRQRGLWWYSSFAAAGPSFFSSSATTNQYQATPQDEKLFILWPLWTSWSSLQTEWAALGLNYNVITFGIEGS